MDASQLREYIVNPALEAIEHYSLAASNLLMGTAAQESRLKYVKQLGNGPALGLFQMEPATHDDIWDNYVAHRPDLRARIYQAVQIEDHDAERLAWDFRYAAIMCRVHYLRVPAQLPPANDVWELGKYWKAHYNTPLGAGTVEEFVENYGLVN